MDLESPVLVGRACAQRAMADLFALAVGDDSSCDESPPSAVVPSAEVCAPVTPPAAAAASKPSIAPRRRKSTMSSGGVQQRKSRAPAAKARLVRVEVGVTPSAWTTVFLQRRAGTGACQKRPRGAGDVVPVTLWPQYTVPTLTGTFIVVSPAEAWLSRMLSSLRSFNGDPPTRILARSLSQAVRVMIRKGFAGVKGVAADAGQDSDEDLFDEGDGKQASVRSSAVARRRASGYTLENAFALDVTIADYPLTVANCGRNLIVLMDDKCLRFVSEALVSVIRQLKATPADVEEPQCAPFRFDDAVPNVRDKVIWAPTLNSWKVLAHTKTGGAGSARTLLADEAGRSFQVDPSLNAAAHERAKQDMWLRAVDCWNKADQSKRQRIAAPPTAVTLPSKSSSPSTSDASDVGGRAEFRYYTSAECVV